ncbi:hypothetical protein ACQ4LE_011160 [Meloidogyne hapla]
MFSPYSSAGGTGLSRRVSLAGAVDSDELRKCISERSGTKPKMQDLPVSGEDDDDSVLTEEKTNITCPVGTPGNAAVSAMIKCLFGRASRDAPQTVGGLSVHCLTIRYNSKLRLGFISDELKVCWL